ATKIHRARCRRRARLPQFLVRCAIKGQYRLGIAIDETDFEARLSLRPPGTRCYCWPGEWPRWLPPVFDRPHVVLPELYTCAMFQLFAAASAEKSLLLP